MRNVAGGAVFLSLFLLVYTSAPCLATTVCDVQDYDPSTGFSWLVGQTVTVTGVVTVGPGIFVPSQTSIFIRGLGDDVCGINVFTFGPSPVPMTLGDTITVTGEVEEYVISGDGATTEIVLSGPGITNLRKSDTLHVEPEDFTTGSVGREENEGRLVRVSGRVTAKEGSREITIDDNSGGIDVYDMGRTFESDPTWRNLLLGDLVTVTGILSQTSAGPPYLSGYRIWPRSPEPPYEDVRKPECIPDTVTARATLEIVDPDGRKISLLCPECPDGPNMVIIRYNGPNTWRVELRIFDAYGRNVATLDDFFTACGEVEIEWTGRNELSERLPVGLYHVVVTATNPRTGDTSQDVAPLVIGKRLK